MTSHGNIAKLEVMGEATKDFRGMTARPVVVVYETFESERDVVRVSATMLPDV
jgi:hypothetical protein